MFGSRRSEHARISLGRKAGLNTRDLYSALAALPPERDERRPGESDGNGYVAGLDDRGQRVYRPVAEGRG